MHDHPFGDDLSLFDLAGPVLVILVVSLYLVAAATGRRGWSRGRCVMFGAGAVAVGSSMTGPLADAAHRSFVAHMIVHLLLGMVAPLLLVLSAPVTLVLRSLPVDAARRVSRFLLSRPARFLTEPSVAAVLNVGGLWILYTTSLFTLMHQHQLVLVHVHVFIAGGLFTVALVGVDPTPHRRGFVHRCAVLVLASGHAQRVVQAPLRAPAGWTQSIGRSDRCFGHVLRRRRRRPVVDDPHVGRLVQDLQTPLQQEVVHPW